MFTSYRIRAVLPAFLLSMGIMAVAADDSSEKLSRKTYDVHRLINSDGSAELIDLIQEIIATRTWTNTGGAGSIEVEKKGQLDVFQTAAVHKDLADFLEALGKLPSLQVAENKQAEKAKQGQSNSESKKAEKPTKQILQIPAGTNATTGQIVVIYYWNGSVNQKSMSDLDSLIENITSAIAPKTWKEAGGTGVIMAYPKGQAIVVLQSKAVHKQIEQLLANNANRRTKNAKSGTLKGNAKRGRP